MDTPRKPNRPLIGKTKARRLNVTLPDEVSSAVRKLANGNLSAGIRFLLDFFKGHR